MSLCTLCEFRSLYRAEGTGSCSGLDEIGSRSLLYLNVCFPVGRLLGEELGGMALLE